MREPDPLVMLGTGMGLLLIMGFLLFAGLLVLGFAL